MKIILLLFTCAVSVAHAQDVIKVTGLKRTEMEAAWGIKTKGREGRLDCQSFMHYVSFSTGTQNITKHLGEAECEEWFQVLRRSHAFNPICFHPQDLSRISCHK